MQRLKRRVIALLLLAAVLTGLAKLALASDYAAREAKTRIQAAIGAPVDAQTIDLGFIGSAFADVKVFETISTSQPPAWTTAKAVDADMSLWQILTNDLGRSVVTLRDVAVTLAFDRDGLLITHMPQPPEVEGPMPLIRIEGGSFTIRREGVPTETFHNIKLELRTDGERQTLTGTINDPDWGPWIVSGGRQKTADPFTLILKTAKEVKVTMPLLRRVPFVALRTWQAVEVEGDTPCEVTLKFPASDRVRYKADLSPHNTAVFIPSINLRTAATSGRVVMEDGVLTLSNIQGTAGGGDIRVGSTMDFRTPGGSVLRFGVNANKINPKFLPDTWQVPGVDGQIDGKADLELTLRNGWLVGTKGQGQGTLRMFPFLRPLSLYMEADGRGFRFGLGKG